jgi:glutaredoxin
MYTVYSKDNCGNCARAKNLLQTKNLAFEEVKLNRDISLEDFRGKYPDVRSMPFILEDQEVVGGLAQLSQHVTMKGMTL